MIRTSIKNSAEYIRGRVPFDAGNLMGINTVGYGGWASEPFVEGALAAYRDFDSDFFVIYSYQTPIAYYYRGEWHFDTLRHSLTTARHITTVKRAIS